MPHIPEIEIDRLPDPLPEEVVVLDVREHDEWRAGHIEGALHIPLAELPGRVDDLSGAQQVLVVCKVGGRSAQAAAFLQACGLDVVNLVGGMRAWDASQRSMTADTTEPPYVA